MLFVFELSNQNKAYLGLTKSAFLIFLTLGSILGGPLGQKFNRKKILILSNLCRIPLVLLLMFFENVHLIILVNALVAFFTGIYNPSRHTMVNDLVEPSKITAANSVFSSTMAILHIVGPFVGAFAYSYFKGITEVLSFDLFTYVIGIFLLLAINYKVPKNDQEDKEDQSFSQEIKEGLSYVKKRLDLISLYLNCIVGGLCIGIFIPLLLPFVKEVLQGSDEEYGVLLSLFGIGGLMGGVLSSKLSKVFQPGRLITLSICIEALIMNVWVYTHSYYYSIAVTFVWGFFVFIRLPSQLNYISKTVETHFLTRTHSLLDLSFVVPNIVGGLVVALIGNYFSTLDSLKAVGILFILLTWTRLPFGEMKSLLNSTREQVMRDTSSHDQI